MTSRPSQAQQQQVHRQAATCPYPGGKVMGEAARLSITLDKPIMLDYWAESLTGEAFIGIIKSEGGCVVLAKNNEEYTSANLSCKGVDGKASKEYIFETNNSIYIVSSAIGKKHFSPTS